MMIEPATDFTKAAVSFDLTAGHDRACAAPACCRLIAVTHAVAAPFAALNAAWAVAPVVVAGAGLVVAVRVLAVAVAGPPDGADRWPSVTAGRLPGAAAVGSDRSKRMTTAAPTITIITRTAAIRDQLLRCRGGAGPGPCPSG